MALQSAGDEILFFIPDLGGFTRFIAETEIRHSQHIIQELLEILADANMLGMKVSEFEGDAVLFYRNGAPPSVEQLVQQARKMYLAVHTHLKKFEYHRVCQCGACSSASGITLKMVAHSGLAGTMRVKEQLKFIGKDIIIAHRLLKNSVNVVEYLLVTQATLARLPRPEDELASFAVGADDYDNLGTIAYHFRSLDDYRAEIKVVPPAPVRLHNPRRMARVVRRVDAPMQRIYQRLIDLPGRIDWIEGITRVEMSDDLPNHIGKTHRCVRGEAGSAVTTTEIKASADTMELWETDLKKIMACRYVLNRTADGATDVAVELHLRDGLFPRLVFRLLLQRKLTAMFEKSIANLAALCEKPDPERVPA